MNIEKALLAVQSLKRFSTRKLDTRIIPMPSLFFTKAAALRILQAQGIAAKQVETLRIFKGSIRTLA
jgi:hypothetical protein